MNSVSNATQDVHAGDLAPRVARIGLVVGVLGLIIGAGIGLTGDVHVQQHFWFAYLVAFAFVLTICLGTLFFTMIQHLVNAHWSVTVRRLSEITMSTLPAICLLGLPLVIPLFQTVEHHGEEVGMLWKWSSGGAHHVEAEAGDAAAGEDTNAAPEAEATQTSLQEQDPLQDELNTAEHHEFVDHKRPFLNKGFFIGRIVFYFLCWTLMARYFFKGSVKQDTADDIEPTLRMKKWSAVAIIAFALTLSFASFDLLMSLDETWFSTIFGVIIFAGAFIASFAWIILLSKFLQKKGLLKAAVNKEHYHDLGKFLFAFVFFWGYVSFSQFMLIWYANLPEETHFFENRIGDAWMGFTWFLLIGHFLIPFPGLLSRHVKRNTAVLGGWAAYMLVMHWVDLYWYVMPNMDPSNMPFGVMEVVLTVGMVGLLVCLIARQAGKQPLLAVNDPLLSKSLEHINQ